MHTFTDAELDLLARNGLLCPICELQLATVKARFHTGDVCPGCAESEPEPEDEPITSGGRADRQVVLLSSQSGTYREWDVTVEGVQYCVVDEGGDWTLLRQEADQSWQDTDTDEDVGLWLETHRLVLSM